MAFDNAFLRHTWLWNLADGEVASTRIHWMSETPLIAIGDVGEDLATRAATFWENMKSIYAPATEFIGGRVQLIGENGLVAETQEWIDTPSPGTASAPSLPTEVAITISLRSALVSKRGRGRSYMPCTANNQLTAAGRFFHPNRDTMAAEFAAYGAPITVGLAEFNPCVASYTAQQLNQVVQIRVGDVFDVQRRRRDELAESYAIEDL